MTASHGDHAMEPAGQRPVTFYHRVIFKPKAEANVSFKVGRRFQALLVTIDVLLEGFDIVGDGLMGRYRALKDAATTGSCAVAREFEAVPQRDGGLVTYTEGQRAVALQSRRVCPHTALRTVRGGVAAAPDHGEGVGRDRVRRSPSRPA